MEDLGSTVYAGCWQTMPDGMARLSCNSLLACRTHSATSLENSIPGLAGDPIGRIKPATYGVGSLRFGSEFRVRRSVRLNTKGIDTVEAIIIYAPIVTASRLLVNRGFRLDFFFFAAVISEFTTNPIMYA